MPRPEELQALSSNVRYPRGLRVCDRNLGFRNSYTLYDDYNKEPPPPPSKKKKRQIVLVIMQAPIGSRLTAAGVESLGVSAFRPSGTELFVLASGENTPGVRGPIQYILWP